MTPTPPTRVDVGSSRPVSPVMGPAVRPAGFLADLVSVAYRSLAQVRRDTAELVPSLAMPFFIFAIFVGSLEGLMGGVGIADFRAYLLPVALIMAMTGVTRATALVTDITSGYFDRMLMTPMNRYALLLGMMVTDFITVILMSIPVLVLGVVVGVEFVTGVPGMLVFVGIAAGWAIGYVGWLYWLALRTGSATMLAQAYLLVIPFIFLTTAIVPQDQMTGWMSAVANVNPLTYIFDALRSLITEGWDGAAIGKALLAIGIVAAIAHSMAMAALRGRVSRGRV